MSQPPGTGPYVPSGTQGQYVPPGTPGQAPWLAQGMAPARPSPPPSPTAPQPKPRSPRGWFAAVAIVAGLALVFGTTFFLGRLTSPGAATPGATTTGSAPSAVVTTTPPPTSATKSLLPHSGTPTKGFTFNGTSLAGPNFTATLPSGWVVAANNGDKNDGAADGASGRIAYWAGSTTRAATLCPNVATSLKAAPTDVATDVVGVRWGTLNAVAKDLVTKSLDTGDPVAYTVYCVDLPSGASSLLVAYSTPAEHSTHKAAVVPFLAGWVWR